MSAQLSLSILLLSSLLLQAIFTQARLLIVMAAAGLACLFSVLHQTATPSQLLSDVPWDVLVILVALGLLSDLFAESRIFGRLAVIASRASKARLRWVALVFAVFMYLVSGVVNNLTALLLMLPILLSLLRLLEIEQRSLSWCLGVLLVACNLGGAATPIGDFPAILLLSRGEMTFGDYLGRAAPMTALALCLLLAVTYFIVRPYPKLPSDEATSKLTGAIIDSLYRRAKIERKIVIPTALWLVLMLSAWLVLPKEFGGYPELVSWLGVAGALALRPSLGEKLLRRGGNGEGVLFLFSLFVMVVAVRKTGLFTDLAQALLALPFSPEGRLVVFLLVAGISTGIFSAGPSMAALLEVGQALTSQLPGPVVYVGLALSVCAGSSLFLTAATSGPLTQSLTEEAKLQGPNGEALRFGFFQFLPVGLLSFFIIQGVAILYALISIL
jgi:Na+/H+ antiporter NhaD/arsenite permease-like protein